jgi:hypothetical protein
MGFTPENRGADISEYFVGSSYQSVGKRWIKRSQENTDLCQNWIIKEEIV